METSSSSHHMPSFKENEIEKNESEAVDRNVNRYIFGEDTCLICLIQDVELESLFSEKYINILQILKFCTTLNIDTTDKYPKHICTKCVDELYIAYAFLQRSKYSLKVINEFIIPLANKDDDNTLDADQDCLSEYEVKEEDENISDDDAKEENLCLDIDNPDVNKNLKDDELPELSDIWNTQEARKRYLCPDCGFYATNLEDHAATHSNIRPYKCKICGKQYKSKSSLHVHNRNHTGEIKYSCKHCDKKFRTWSGRKRHINITHENLWPFVCQVCNKPFRLTSRLNIHMRIHTNERPFSCKYCSKSFYSKSVMLRHENRHKGEKKHFCTVCDKRFFRKFEVDQHMVSHTGERKHKCVICNKAFTQKHVLRTHMKTHNVDEIIEECNEIDNNVNNIS